MGLARTMQGRTRMKFEELFERQQAGATEPEDAARCWAFRCGPSGAGRAATGAEDDDGLLDRVSGNRIPADTGREVLELF